jgi:hypothetical protein
MDFRFSKVKLMLGQTPGLSNLAHRARTALIRRRSLAGAQQVIALVDSFGYFGEVAHEVDRRNHRRENSKAQLSWRRYICSVFRRAVFRTTARRCGITRELDVVARSNRI